jgi:hypothetical protein
MLIQSQGKASGRSPAEVGKRRKQRTLVEAPEIAAAPSREKRKTGSEGIMVALAEPLAPTGTSRKLASPSG